MSRDAMKLALREHFVTALRERDFRGTLPHFRRIHASGIDLLTVQFDKWGGGFVIELGRCGPEGFTMSWGEHVPPAKVTAHHLGAAARHRLGAPGPDQDGVWFRFDDGTAPEIVARRAAAMLVEADRWWASRGTGNPG